MLTVSDEMMGMLAGPSCGCVRVLHCSPQAQADGRGVHEETVTGLPAS